MGAHYTGTTQKESSTSLVTAYFIFFLAASFYLYEFILQVAPSVMAESMMKTFGVSGEGFGFISAFYFYAYAPTQLPAGVLYDRYGPRKLMTFAIILCALGSAFFASTDSVFTACIGRFLIGIGSAFSFIGVLVLLSRWFPPYYFAILAGVAQLMSSVGAMFGEMPLAYLIQEVGWRNASFILSIVGFILAVFFWIYIRDYPHQKNQTVPEHYLRDEWKRLVAVCKHGYTWIIGGYAFAIWTPIAVFAALWGVPYLQEKFQISVVAASGLCSMIWIGIGIGSPLLGWLSDKIESRRIALIISAALGLFATLVLLYLPGLSYGWAPFILFVLGLGAGGQTVSFAVVKENNPPELVGTASGFNNLSVLIGGAIFQPLVGYILQHTNSWHLVNGVHIYSIASYQMALVVMPVCFLGSLLIAGFLLKESHPARQP
ncbi:MFS transporter [Fluoribacter dumoffii]|uniref:Lysosomal dipeptide transporter MFSD1 n=1 Tax=Fluoribacter dumoffii TaxID=463 RepID=A0A377GA04_9GAMM|nr:MFS transporter [Fluoribacter dumoffii]KTC89003.1 major facilitator family transporter [Fluoribacter dumoffii NY 23]MCW8385785.1 MFS transporter [Fluoribacter dumoffii]MCW8418818.1 MFS transporter [Fluoribacter dumoffii]MCW8453338.1 MFS transporter [Fluoribacter dumoffii]MCW8459441.1 MFS transporter [Fluoribacter dumoffii]